MNTYLNDVEITKNQNSFIVQAILPTPFDRASIKIILSRGQRIGFLYYTGFDHNMLQHPVSIKKILKRVEVGNYTEFQVASKIANSFVLLSFHNHEPKTMRIIKVSLQPIDPLWCDFDFDAEEYVINKQRYTKTLMQFCNSFPIIKLEVTAQERASNFRNMGQT